MSFIREELLTNYILENYDTRLICIYDGFPLINNRLIYDTMIKISTEKDYETLYIYNINLLKFIHIYEFGNIKSVLNHIYYMNEHFGYLYRNRTK